MHVFLQKSGDGLFSNGQRGGWTADKPHDFKSTAAALDFATKQDEVLLRDLQIVLRHTTCEAPDTVLSLGAQDI